MTAPARSGPSPHGGGPATAPLPAWEETTKEAAAWDRDWFDRDDEDES